jgi:hypothetical protein
MRNLIIIAIAFLTVQATFAQRHLDWEESDRKIISVVTSINKQNPKEVEAAFSKGLEIPKENLGFGWKQSIMALAGGHITIWAYIYYYDDSIVSYKIQPAIPSDNNLKKQYLQWYGPTYSLFDTIIYQQRNREVVRIIMKPYKYNENGILKPLKQFANYSDVKLSNEILKYMSPESGLSYGWGGGMPPTIFPNRKTFNSIKDSLTIDEVTALLYSINPASRLSAIELCIKKQYPILKNPTIARWIDKLYTEVPQMYTLNGCIGNMQDSRQLVEQYSKISLDKE